MEKESHEDIPDSLKEYLEARRAHRKKKSLPQNEMNAPADAPPAMTVELLSEEEQFQNLWANLSRKALVVVTDLELLAGYKEYMTMEHIVAILKRADVSTESFRLEELRRLLYEKRDQHLKKDPYLLQLPEEVADYLAGSEYDCISSFF